MTWIPSYNEVPKMKNYQWGNAVKPLTQNPNSHPVPHGPKDLEDDKGLDWDNDSSDMVKSEGNTIFFYATVTPKSIISLVKEIRELDKTHQKFAIDFDLPAPPPIRLNIHSYGGSLFAGFAGANAILNTVSPVHTHVEGCAASAATLLSIVGDYRTMGDNSFILIHQLSSGFWGKYEEMKDEMVNQDTLMAKIQEIYLEFTEIEEDDLTEILKRDLWFDAETSLGYGLIDEVK